MMNRIKRYEDYELTYYRDYYYNIQSTYDILLDIKTVGFTDLPGNSVLNRSSEFLITLYDNNEKYLGKITYYNINDRFEADRILCELIDYKE